MSDWENNEEIKLFREYLRIPSVHPDVDYAPCIEFLSRQATAINLPCCIFNAKNDMRKPMLIVTWQGLDTTLPAILLNSHMDVVPVFPEKWTHEPFGAEIDKGRIYARGAQDMKCVGMQYLAAIRKMKQKGIRLKRTLHLTFVPDEETGGIMGMYEFVKSKEFQNLNIGFTLDEGVASPTNNFLAFYAEKSLWQIKFKISGNSGHGSLLHKQTTGEKLLHLLNCFYSLRKSESVRQEQFQIDIGDVTTINLTQIDGGAQNNVLPPQIEVCFDLRVAIDVDLLSLEETIRQWCLEAGGGIEMEWTTRVDTAPPTKHDMSDKYWMAFMRATENLNIQVFPRVFCGGTDSQFLRELGIPAIGFSPINNTPVLLHDHDEYLGADTYLRGIDIFVKILEELGNTD